MSPKRGPKETKGTARSTTTGRHTKKTSVKKGYAKARPKTTVVERSKPTNRKK